MNKSFLGILFGSLHYLKFGQYVFTIYKPSCVWNIRNRINSFQGFVKILNYCRILSLNGHVIMIILAISCHAYFQKLFLRRNAANKICETFHYIILQKYLQRWSYKTFLSNFIKITLLHRCSPVNLLHIFRTPFPKNTSKGLLLTLPKILVNNYHVA